MFFGIKEYRFIVIFLNENYMIVIVFKKFLFILVIFMSGGGKNI